MSERKRFQDTDAIDLPPELLELGELIAELDGHQGVSMSLCYQRVVEAVHRRRRILGLVQEALSQLRLDVKYLMFDLETTRNERDALQERIEEQDREF